MSTDAPVLTVTPSDITLFRFSAVTWNPHRIHYNEGYARSEDRPGVLVHSHLRAAYAMEAALRYAGPGQRIRNARYRVRVQVVPGTELRYSAAEVSLESGARQVLVTETTASGVVGLEGTFTLVLEEGQKNGS